MTNIETELLNNSIDIKNIFSYAKKMSKGCKERIPSDELIKTYNMDINSYGSYILSELEYLYNLYNKMKEQDEILNSFQNTRLTLIEKIK